MSRQPPAACRRAPPGGSDPPRSRSATRRRDILKPGLLRTEDANMRVEGTAREFIGEIAVWAVLCLVGGAFIFLWGRTSGALGHGASGCSRWWPVGSVTSIAGSWTRRAHGFGESKQPLRGVCSRGSAHSPFPWCSAPVSSPLTRRRVLLLCELAAGALAATGLLLDATGVFNCNTYSGESCTGTRSSSGSCSCFRGWSLPSSCAEPGQ